MAPFRILHIFSANLVHFPAYFSAYWGGGWLGPRGLGSTLPPTGTAGGCSSITIAPSVRAGWGASRGRLVLRRVWPANPCTSRDPHIVPSPLSYFWGVHAQSFLGGSQQAWRLACDPPGEIKLAVYIEVFRPGPLCRQMPFVCHSQSSPHVLRVSRLQLGCAAVNALPCCRPFGFRGHGGQTSVGPAPPPRLWWRPPGLPHPTPGSGGRRR